jgi:peptide/nickel transport system substrate-binding protein
MMTRHGDRAAMRSGNFHSRERISRRRLVGGASALAASLALGPTGSRVARAYAQEDEPSILIGTLGEAVTINPFLIANESEGDWRCKMLFDRFVRANPASYALEPGLASEWTIDDLTITFKLQPTAKFSDGSDVTANDVAFTIKGMIAKGTASPRQTKYLSIAGAQEYADGAADDVSGIKVLDPKTLEVTLAKPDAPFLFNMSYVYVVPQVALDGKSLTDDPFFQNPVGAGPYVFESWTTGADFVATKNANYWQEGKPTIARFTHRVIADAQSLVLALQSGEIDGSNYPNPAAKAELEQNANLTVLVPPFSSPNGWMFNAANEHLAKKDVRRAIAMSLDTKQFAADSLLGLGKPGLGPIAPDSWAFDPTLEPTPFDPEAAKKMISDAGAAGAQIRFMVNQGNVLREDWLTYTQQALQGVGIEVVPEVIEYATLTDRVTTAKDYDACGVDFVGVTAEPSELYEQFHSDSPGNYMNYSNPDLDKLLEQAKETLDQDTAKPIYAKIQRIIMDDMPMDFAWYRPFLHAVDKRFTGYTDSAAYGLFETLEDWTVTG